MAAGGQRVDADDAVPARAVLPRAPGGQHHAQVAVRLAGGRVRAGAVRQGQSEAVHVVLHRGGGKQVACVSLTGRCGSRVWAMLMLVCVEWMALFV